LKAALPRLVCVTGLPRAGSTFICQLLDQHPAIYSPGHSSPLFPALTGLRRELSDDDFLLAQLDQGEALVLERLRRAYQGFVAGWFAETDLPTVVDKNRGWLNQLELLVHLVPDAKLIVCVRELSQVWGSIEAQHRASVLLDFPDHTADLSQYARADRFFGPDGVVGFPLAAIEASQDYPEPLRSRLFFLVFEHLMADPKAVLAQLFGWLELPPHDVALDRLDTAPHESDSYYRLKFRHRRHATLRDPVIHDVPPRIVAELESKFEWFYKTFYPGESK
jgi:sulfotransferase